MESHTLSLKLNSSLFYVCSFPLESQFSSVLTSSDPKSNLTSSMKAMGNFYSIISSTSSHSGFRIVSCSSCVILLCIPHNALSINNSVKMCGLNDSVIKTDKIRSKSTRQQSHFLIFHSLSYSREIFLLLLQIGYYSFGWIKQKLVLVIYLTLFIAHLKHLTTNAWES